jgi:hypothetical protein
MVSESAYNSHLKTYSLVLIKNKQLFEENILPKLVALAKNDTSAWYQHALEFPRPPWLPANAAQLLTDLGYEKAIVPEAEDVPEPE